MAVKIVQYKRFVYILYEKNGSDSSKEFKDTLQKQVEVSGGDKDIILDLSRCQLLISPELGMIAKALSYVEKNNRSVRIISNPAVSQILRTTGIGAYNKNSLVIYETPQAFAEELKKAGNEGLELPPPPLPSSVKIILSGVLSGEKVKEMSAQAESAFRGNCECIILDLNAVELMDSVCLAQLMYLEEASKNRNKQLVLTGVQDHLLELFKDTHLDHLLQIAPAEN